MVDVLFTHSYFLKFDPKEYAGMRPYPPLGTLYAASVARQHGHRVALFDSMLAESEEEIEDLLRKHHPPVVVIYDDDFNYLTKMCLTRMREAAFALAKTAHKRGALVIVHGSDPTDHLDVYLEHGADFLICGEGEQTLADLLDHLLGDGPPPEQIPGLAYLRDHKMVRTGPREALRDLDLLPFPARDLLDNDRYRMAWMKQHGYFSTNIVTTRGCPFHCNWCAKPVYGQVYNTRSPENVAREMAELRETLHPDHLWFCDDIFGLKPGWTGQFAREVRKRHAAVPFKCLARVDLLLRDDAIRHLHDAGCRSVWVGAESGSQKILDAMEKGTTVAQIYEASAGLHAAGIGVGFFLQYGYPGETLADIRKTLRMVRDCRPDELGISVSYPLPGTPFYRRVQDDLREKQNWVDSDDLDLMFRGTYGREFYKVLHRYTHKLFRFWQGIEMLKRLSRLRTSVTLKVLRCLAAATYHALTLPAIRLRLLHLMNGGRASTTGGASHA